jgi:hypothetical protein
MMGTHKKLYRILKFLDRPGSVLYLEVESGMVPKMKSITKEELIR